MSGLDEECVAYEKGIPYEELRAFEGRRAVTRGLGKDPVNSAMIRHWCEAMGDANPAYAGAEQVAPPTMLQVWTMGGLSGHDGRSAAYDELWALLDGAGYTSVVATDCEQEYVRALRPGDEVTFDAVIESVSARKTTKLGTGHFVTTRMDVGVGARLVGTHRFRILKYAPARRKPPGRRPRPVINRDNAGFWEGVAAHRLLIQRCGGCGELRFPWLPGCNSCGSPAWDTVEASGEGTVYSYVVMHHPPFPAFDPPYAVALVELAEGVRIVSNVIGVPYDEVRIGMPVRLAFQRVDEELELPMFRASAPWEGAGSDPEATPSQKPPSQEPPSQEPPYAQEPSPKPPQQQDPAQDQPTGVGMKAGDALPPLEIPVTRTLIVAGAIASRDYQDVHHDAELAGAKGSPDIFMNILTTNGLVGRYITDHFGPTATLRKVAIRLGAPNYPGDTMVLTGTIGDVGVSPEGRAATVEVVGANGIGKHVTGTVTVTLPSQEATRPTGDPTCPLPEEATGPQEGTA